MEELEARQMMAITATLQGNVLAILGTDQADTATINRTKTAITISETGQSFSVKQVKAIDVALLDGDDILQFNYFNKKNKQVSGWVDIAVTTQAGGGDDTFIGTNAHTVYYGGSVDTLTISKAGNQKINGERLTWFDTSLIASDVRQTAKTEFAAHNKKFTREVMLKVFEVVATAGDVSNHEFTSLTTLVNYDPLYKSVHYVQVLAGYVVNGTSANAHYQSQTLGNLAVGSSKEHLETLVSKWYFGTDLPGLVAVDDTMPEYRQVAGQLFVGGVNYEDTNDPQFNQINQGALGDCYYLAGLGAIARNSGKPIKEMFVDNGDGTYTVRFFANGKASSVYYVTVNHELPTNQAGELVYAGTGKMFDNPQNELWVALAEKAYAQVAEFGWVLAGPENLRGTNSYAAIDGGYAGHAMADILGKATAVNLPITESTRFEAIAKLSASSPVVFNSREGNQDPRVPGGHAYAVVGYDAKTQKFQLYNPWGVDTGAAKALFWLSWSEITPSFDSWCYGPRV